MSKSDFAPNKSALFLSLAASLLVAGVLFAALSLIRLPGLIPSMLPAAGNLAISLGVSLLIGLMVLPRFLHRRFLIVPGILAVLLLVTLWLGSYPFSPLGYSSGRIPFLRGFLVTTYGGRRLYVTSGEVISLGNGTFNSIEPITLPANIRCTWASLNGGALDDPHSCDTAYIPLGPDDDILRVRIVCGCGLPDTVGEIKISIMP